MIRKAATIVPMIFARAHPCGRPGNNSQVLGKDSTHLVFFPSIRYTIYRARLLTTY